jgi:hypothetical protein
MDSVPENEWDVSERKADAMISVLKGLKDQKSIMVHQLRKEIK